MFVAKSPFLLFSAGRDSQCYSYPRPLLPLQNLCIFLEFPLRRTKSELPTYHKKSRKELKERKRVDSSSERRRDMSTRHDSIQEESTLQNAIQDVSAEEDLANNPFARDEEFVNDSASQSSASSVVSESRFHEVCYFFLTCFVSRSFYFPPVYCLSSFKSQFCRFRNLSEVFPKNYYAKKTPSH